MQSIPAICRNPKCGTIFPGIKLIGLENSNCRSIEFEGKFSAGACPSCGEKSKVVNGVYSVVKDKLFGEIQKIDDFLLLQKALNTLNKELGRKKSPKNVKKKLCKKHPALNAVWSIFPNNKTDAYAFIGILITLIALIVQMGGCQAEDSEVILNKTYQNLYSQPRLLSQQNNPSNNHISQKSRPNKLIDL